MADTSLPDTDPVQFQAAPRTQDAFYPIPDIGELIPDAQYQKVLDFTSHMINYLESFREECKSARPEYFDERVDRDVRWAVSDLELFTRSDTGDVVETEGDGHAFMGLTHGLSAQAARAAAAMLSRQLLTNHIKPFMIVPTGSKDENKTMVELLTSLIEDLLAKGDFEARLRTALSEIPKAQVVALRYMMGADSDLTYDPVSGSYAESRTQLKPMIEVWPIKQLFVADPNESDPERQEGIFWTSQVTLLDLQRNEAVDGKPQRGGRFLNLEQVQRETEQAQIQSTGYDRASMFPQMALVEYEGALPFSRFVHAGIFTPEIAEIFGIPGPKGTSVAELTEWGRTLERIRVWWVSYISSRATTEFAGVGQTGIGNHMIQCEPARGIRGRNSLFAFRYHRDGTKFYGRSLSDLCCAIEKCCDSMLNAYWRTVDFNANPPILFDASRLRDMSQEEAAQRLSTPGSWIPLKPGLQGSDVDKIIKYAKLPEIPNAMETLSYFRALHEAQTGVTAMSKGVQGQTDTGTLGELEIMQSQSTMETDERILSYSQEISRLISRILEDFFFYFQPGDELIQYLERVSGMPGTEIMECLPSLNPLSEEYRIEHPIQAQQDMAIRATLLMKCLEMFPDVLTDRAEALRLLIEASGMPRLARELTRTQRLMSPEDEHRQMRVGNYCTPNPAENLPLHLQAHMAEMAMLTSVQPSLQPGTPDSDEMILEAQQLPQHITETQQLLDLMMQQMAMQQPQPDPGGLNSEGSQKKVAPEGDRPANEMETAVNVNNEAQGKGGANNETGGGI